MIRTIKKGNCTVKVVPEQDVQAAATPDDAEMDKRVKAAVKSELDRAIICKRPVAKYDRDSKKAYIQLPDGQKKYVL